MLANPHAHFLLYNTDLFDALFYRSISATLAIINQDGQITWLKENAQHIISVNPILHGGGGQIDPH